MNRIFPDLFDRVMAYISLIVVPYGVYLSCEFYYSGEIKIAVIILCGMLLSASNYWYKILEFLLTKKDATTH